LINSAKILESFTATIAVTKVISDFDTQMKLMRHFAPHHAAINKGSIAGRLNRNNS